jgi:alkanesulfonate monooxygenase SsuD/methylene tetrahydromethanopterin reductase-like flavin-dependent oxidoreductase (luciferase family)
MGRSREAGRATNLTYEEIFNEYAIAGDPQECIDRLAAFREMFQCQGFMFWFNIGGLLPGEEVDKSMGLFAEKVMSHFQ